MTIGIIVAMGKELALLTPMLGGHETVTINGQQFHTGTLGQHQVVAMQCGIGKVNAAIGALTLIREFHPALIINTGVAGGADGSVMVMDVVAGAQVAYHDVWCGPESTLGAVQGLPLYYEGDAQLLSLLPHSTQVKQGLIASGDQFIDSLERVEAIKQNFPHALAVDMESAAIAQVCYLNKTRFLSLRIISDSPGASRDNTKQYNDFWDEAPRESFALVKELIAKI